jgi:hypothetical protein
MFKELCKEILKEFELQELYTTNGIKLYWYKHKDINFSYEKDGVYSNYDASVFTYEEKALEQACMQYCIENGVKLEWLPTHSQGIIKRTTLRNVLSSTSMSDEEMRLIAAIYAHDIKIIA